MSTLIRLIGGRLGGFDMDSSWASSLVLIQFFTCFAVMKFLATGIFTTPCHVKYEFTCDISRCITCLDSYCLSASALARARSRSPPTPSGRPNKVADGAVSFGAVTRFPDVSWCFLFAVSPSMSCPCASFTHETQEKSEKKSTPSDFQAFSYAISRMNWLTPRMTNSCAQTFFFFLAAQASAPLTKSSLSSSTCRFKIRMSFRSQTNLNKSKGRNSQSTKKHIMLKISIICIIISYTYI